eukprot:gene1367-2639_t
MSLAYYRNAYLQCATDVRSTSISLSKGRHKQMNQQENSVPFGFHKISGIWEEARLFFPSASLSMMDGTVFPWYSELEEKLGYSEPNKVIFPQLSIWKAIMGNVLDVTVAAGDEDIKWLNVPNSNIFNDSYINGEYENLPKFDGTDVSINTQGDDPTRDGTNASKIKLERLLEIFSNMKSEARKHNIECYSNLDEMLSKWNFTSSNKMRARLLLRIHLALLREAESKQRSDDSENCLSIASSSHAVDDPNALLTASSVRMSLAMVKSLGPLKPELYRVVAEAMMDLFRRSSDMALSKVEEGSLQADTVKGIMEYAEDMTKSREGLGPEDRAQALALMLAVAVTSGSVRDVLSVVTSLQSGTERLPPSAATFLDRLRSLRTDLRLSSPSPATVMGSFKASLSPPMTIPDDQLDFTCSSVCTNGVHLFLWNGLDCTITKVGTGYHNTIAGGHVSTSVNIEKHLRERLKDDVYEERAPVALARPRPGTNSISDGETTFRRIRVTRKTVGVRTSPGQSLVSALQDSDENSVPISEGFQSDILGEQVVSGADLGGGTSQTFYLVEENLWIASMSPEDEDGNSDSDEDSSDSDGGGNGNGASQGSRLAVEITGQTEGVVPGTGTVGATSSSTTGEGAASSNVVVGGTAVAGVFRHAWLVYANGKIILRMRHLLGPYRIAIFSLALKLEDIVEISLPPIPQYMKMKKVWEDKRRGGLAEVVEEEDPEAVEWVLGEEINYAVVGHGAQVKGASSNFASSDGSLEKNLLLPSTERQPLSDETDTRYLFADGDESQHLVLDLGKTYTPVKLGAEFAVGADPRAVGETFSVHVSVDGDTFQEWNTALLSSDTSAPMEGPMLLTISESYNGPEQIRFVRYSFGGNSKSGSAVSQLFAFARQKVKKPPMEICPALCSDGRHLVFLHASSVRSKDSGDKEKEYFLQAITLAMDPHDPSTTTVLSTVNFQWGLEEELLSQCTFACNSEKVLVLHRKGFASRKKEEKNADFNCRAFELSSGRQLSISGVTFAKSQGLPSGVCYDNRNNFIWSWDCVTSSVNRWRNDGLAPRFRTSLSETANPMLSSCPKCRLDAINTTPGGLFTSETEAALILCELDRISELYSPPTLPIAEADMTDKIEVVSVGSDDPGGGQCKILLRGQCCGPTERGFNIVVLNGQFGFGEIRSFDTVENENASERLADFIESIPEGKIVLVATQESASDKLTGRATTALRSIGADKIDRLGSRGAFAMVGRKGAAPGSVPQSLSERRKGPARARRLLPAPKIPLAVEASADTVSVLVKLTMVYYDNIKNGSTKELHKVMLLSCFRLLTTNIFQLLRGTPIKVACEAFQEEHRKSIMDIVTELIENPPATEGGATIASEALRLFTTSLDILYPSVAEKCALLVRYLESFAGGTLSSLQRSVLEILLRQMSAPSSLAMLLHSQEENASTDAGALFDSLLSIAKKETLSELEALVMEEEQEPVGMGTGREAAMGVSVGHKVGEAAVQMLQSLSNMVLSQSAQTVILEASDESKEEMSGGVEKSSTSSSSSGKVAVDLLKQMLEASGEILGNVLRVNESFLTAAGLSTEEGGGDLDVFGTGTGTRTRNTLHVDIEELVRVSPVGMLLPVILNAVAQLCQSQGSKMLSSGLDSLSPPLSVCIGHVHKCVTMIPKKTVNMASSEEGCFIKTETFESAHPYASNMDTTTEVSFPGAVKMTFTFDEQSKSENSYDYVKIWKTNDKSEVWHTDVEKYSGRGGSENWPGFGDRPPLVVHGDTACIEFHSDGSNEDWGWKVTVTAEFPTKGVVEQLHWMTQLERQLGYCGAVVISTLVKSLPSDPAMSSGVVWIEDELFSSNIVGMDEWQAEEDSFLKSLMDRSKTALALNFLSKMKNAVVEDLGTIEDINRATYATCAVLIRHAGLAKEALDVAKGTATTTTLSDELVRLWRIGQKIRLLPEFADAMPSMTTTTSTSGSVSTKAENKTTTPQKQHHMSITVGSGMTSTTTAVPDPCKQYTDGIIGRCQLLMRLDVNSALSSHFCDIGPRSSSHADGDSADIFADGIGSSAMDPLLEHEYELSTEGGSLDLASIRSLLVRYRGNRMSTVKSKSKITAGTVSILQSNDSNNNKPSSSSSSSHHVSIVEKILLFIQSSTSAEQLEAIRETRNRRAIYRIKGFEAAVALLSLSLHSPFTLCALLSAVSASLEATKYMPHATATNRVHYLNGIIGCSPGVRRTLSLAFATFLGATVGCMKNANIQSTEKETSQHSEAQQQQHEPVFWRVALLTSLKTCSLDYDAADHADLQSSGLLIEMERMLRSDDSDVSRAAWELLEKLLSNCVRKRSVSMVVTSDDRTTATDMTEDERGRVRLSAKLVSLLVTELQRASSGIFADKQLISVAADDFLPRSYDVVGGAVSVNRDCLGLAFPHTNPFGLSHSMSLWLRRDRSAIEDIIQSRTLRVGTRVSRGKSWSPDCLDDGGDNGFGTVVAVEQGGGGGGGATVDVKWDNSISKMAKKYSYGTVEEDGEVKFEVEIADEYLAGNIYQKGAMNSLEEELRGAVWSSFGLQLRGDASLRVFATSKLDRTWGLQSESRLVAEKWTHVAVVQTKEKCRLYIDGALDVETKMESYMVYPDWGYKITVVADLPVVVSDEMEEIKELNTMPLYVGQAPSYASKAPSFSGGVCRFRLFDTPLSSEQIHRLAADSPPNDLDNIDDMQCLNVLSMLQRCSKQIDILDVQPPANENSNGNGNGDDNTSLMKNNNAEETILVPLLNIVVNGPVLGKIAGLRLCAKLLPPVPMSAIDSACSKVHFQLSLSKGEAEGRDRNSFIGFLTANIGAFLNVWWRRALTTVQSPPPSSSSSRDGYVLSSLPSSRMCEEIALGVAIEQVQLVRALLEHGDPWRECISAFVTDVVRNAPVTIDKLTNILNTHDPSQEQMAGDLEDCLVAVYAVVGLFGGMFAGLSPGSLAGYMRNGHTGGGEGSVEDCVVIAFTWPPSVKDETKEEEGWGDSNVFGDACMISLTSDPSTPLIVPSINLVSYREKTSAAFEEFVAEHAAALGTLFNLLLHMDTTDRRPLRLPKINESDEMIICESEHPYTDGLDTYQEVKLPGAKEIVITFDEQCRTENNCDYVTFYQDSTKSRFFGEGKYCGRDGTSNWPGTGDRAVLVIPAESFILHFHSDGSEHDWGYKFTAKAHCVVRNDPPPRPPLPLLALASHLKMLGMKALDARLQEGSGGVLVRHIIPSARALLAVALSPSHKVSTKGGLESSGGGNSHSIADSAKALLQFIGEGPARQKLPAELNDFPLAEPKSIVPLLAQGIDPQLLCDMEVNALLTDGKSEILTSKLTQLFPRVFTVNAQDASEVMIFAEQNIESAVLGKIPTGDAVTAIRADGDWLFVSFPVPEAAAVSPGTDTAGTDSSASTLTVTEQTVAVGSYLTVSWTGPAPSGKDWIGLYEVEQPSGTNPSLWWVYITADSPHTVCTSESSQHEAWTMPATGAVYEFRYFRGEAYDLVCKSKSIRTVTNGWAKRRSGDSLYLVPADVKVSGSLVVLDEDSVTAMDSTSSSSSVPDSPHPMFAVEEVATTASSNIHYRSPAQVLWGKLDAVETTVHECTLAATTAFAQDAMSALVARWPDDVAFGTDSFGSSSNLMGFMSSVYQREASGLEDASTSVDKSEILCALRERLSNAVRCETEGQGRGEGENITRSLINYSLRILSEDVAGASSLRPTKAISSTEKDCDYCEIYKTAEKRDTDRLGSRYTGRAASGDKLWAGVNTPSLRVQSDTCVVSFHSDGSNTDWGFKLTCYGIMEEPTEDERAEFEARKQSSDSNVGLACWLLHSLANERQVPRVHKLLHTPSTWSLLRRFVDVSAVAADKRNMVVALVSKLVRAMSPGNIDDVLADELRHVVTSLKSILLQQHSKQTDEGKRVVTDFSPQLQSTADALLATIAILRDLTTSNDVHWDTAPAAGSDLVLSNDMRAVKLSENQTVRSQLRTATATATAVTVFSSQVMSLQSYSWNVKVSFTGPGNIGPSVGLASPHSTLGQELGLHKAPSTLSLLSLSLGWRSGQLHLNGMQPVAFGPLINTGDLVGITVTLSPFSVTFYRNSAKVGLAVGPPGSGAAIEIYLEVTQYRPAVSLFYPEDAALIRTGITSIGKDDSDSTDEIIPSWMRSLRQTSELISSCISSTPSSYFLQKDFRPLCEMKSSVTVETSHPYDGSTTATTATATATPFRQVVKIPHATRLTVFIDTSTALNENESVQISGSSCFGVETKTYLGLRGDGGAESRSGDVSVGDVVVRGPDWDWEDQDGGVGNFGDVTELRSWKGKLNKGAVVKWRASNESNLYRFGFEGLFDLTVVQEHNVKGVPMKDVFMGDEVTITIATSSIASSSSPDGSTFKPSFGLRCVVVPSFPMAHVLGNPSYRNLFDRVCYPYTVGGDPNEDGALVELVNRFVKEDSVLKSNWIQLVSAVEADGGNFSNHSERLKVLLAKPPLEISSDDQLVLGPGDMDSDTNVDPWNWGLQQTANSEGNAVRLGGDRGCKGTLYCGLPRDIPGTDGQCGPNNGRNCTSCRELQLCRPPLCGDEGHTLVISDYSLNGYTSGFSCNSCSKTTSRNNIGRTRWFCEACHYDLCFDCHPQFPTPRPRPTTNANNSSSGNSSTTPIPPVVGALGIGSVVGASGSGVPIPTGDASPESVRMDFIVFLNRTVSSSLSLVDFSATSEVWTVASRLAAIRGVIFASVKKSLLDRALRASLNITDTAPKEIKLSKLKATRHQQSGVPDHEARYSIFAQVMRSLHFSPSDSLRVSEGTPMFAAVFEDGGGQSVEDAMTTCRRCFLTIAKELMSGALPLLLPLPSVASKRGDINTNNDTTKQQQLWALNPSATTETHLHMLTFLGKLMGVAIRANIAFPLHLAPIIWKLIVNENTSRNDLLELSPSQVPALVGLRKLFGPNRSEPDVSPENFSSLFRETFSCLSLDGQIVVELIPGGQEQPVTFDRVLEYCDRCESYRLHEMDTQVEAVRRGLAAVIPQKPLALFTGTQLRSMVSGEGLLPPDLSIDTKWIVKVVFREGAKVRGGLELSSDVVHSVDYNTTIEVLERRVNAENIPRLRTERGWMSEMLNPAAGSVGAVAELVPMRNALRMRVTDAPSCAIRQQPDHTAPEVGRLSIGDTVDVVQKLFSADNERWFRVLSPAGYVWWASALNDVFGLELVGLAPITHE